MSERQRENRGEGKPKGIHFMAQFWLPEDSRVHFISSQLLTILHIIPKNSTLNIPRRCEMVSKIPLLLVTQIENDSSQRKLFFAITVAFLELNIKFRDDFA